MNTAMPTMHGPYNNQSSILFITRVADSLERMLPQTSLFVGLPAQFSGYGWRERVRVGRRISGSNISCNGFSFGELRERIYLLFGNPCGAHLVVLLGPTPQL